MPFNFGAEEPATKCLSRIHCSSLLRRFREPFQYSHTKPFVLRFTSARTSFVTQTRYQSYSLLTVPVHLFVFTVIVKAREKKVETPQALLRSPSAERLEELSEFLQACSEE